MSYEIVKIKNGHYSVVNLSTGKILCKDTTMKNAKAQIQLKKGKSIKVLPTLKMKEPIEINEFDGEGLKGFVGTGFKEDVINIGKKVINKVKKTFSKRKANLLPPTIRKFLENSGDVLITNAEIIRTPVSGIITKLFSLISNGQYITSLHEAGYDKAFHLAIIFNGDKMIDKQEVIKISKPNITKETQKLTVSVPSGITFHSLFDKTRELMGNSSLTNYNAKTNNCQDFILGVLNANGMNSPQITEFVKQDAIKIFEGMPQYMEKVAKIATDIGAVANKVVEGEGEKKKRGRPKTISVVKITKKEKPLSWKQHVSQNMKGKKFENRDEANKYFKSLAEDYKKMKEK